MFSRNSFCVCAAAACVAAAVPAFAADSASGAVTVQGVGTIGVSYAVAYRVPDPRNARETATELLLTDTPVDAAAIQRAFDPHMEAINQDALKDRNYVLLWARGDGSVSMNATFSKTMTQYVNDTNGGLTAVWTTHTPARLDGRLTSTEPLKTMDGTSYTVDLRFALDVPRPEPGVLLPAGGGDAGKALVAFVSAARKKDWPAIAAASSPDALKLFDKSYNTPAENAQGAADLVAAWLPLNKMTITGGLLQGLVAVLSVEGEMFPGMMTLSRVRMVNTSGRWQFDRAMRAGLVR